MSAQTLPYFDLTTYWLRRCGDKHQYKSIERAERGARRVEQRTGEAIGAVEPYYCPNCNRFHVGHARRH